jgi:hypothetical protein
MEASTIPEVYERITLPFLGLGTTALVLAILLPTFAILGLMKGRSNRTRKIASGEEVDLRAGEAFRWTKCGRSETGSRTF